MSLSLEFFSYICSFKEVFFFPTYQSLPFRSKFSYYSTKNCFPHSTSCIFEYQYISHAYKPRSKDHINFLGETKDKALIMCLLPGSLLLFMLWFFEMFFKSELCMLQFSAEIPASSISFPDCCCWSYLLLHFFGFSSGYYMPVWGFSSGHDKTYFSLLFGCQFLDFLQVLIRHIFPLLFGCLVLDFLQVMIGHIFPLIFWLSFWLLWPW